MQAGAISLCSEEEVAESCLAVVLGIAGAASLVGAPIGGELIKAGARSADDSSLFLLLQLCTGGLMLVAAATLIVVRVVKTGWSVSVKI